ncbi:hypothetical protein Tco_1447080, partial [Tanacetum coccineum]
MLRRKVGEALRRKGCDDSFLRWSMLRRNPSGMLHRKITVVTLVGEQMSRVKRYLLPLMVIEEEVECTLPTEGMRSIISTVSISLEGFLPSILLLVMIIVAVILVVVVVAIVGVVIVVMIIG